jgi:hypothetical protein
MKVIPEQIIFVSRGITVQRTFIHYISECRQVWHQGRSGRGNRKQKELPLCGTESPLSSAYNDRRTDLSRSVCVELCVTELISQLQERGNQASV